MHRTPTRRQPRVAALVPSGRQSILLVLDAWEVRAVLVRRAGVTLKRLLVAERPIVLVIPRKTSFLSGLRIPLLVRILPKRTLQIGNFPELRRFAAGAHAPAVRQALTLAFNTLTQLAYDPSLSQDRPRPPRRAA